MGLLDFMKQGTQWLTDKTGMDWNKVQSDPGMAAKRLMGAPVDLNSQYQAQPTQNNLLDTSAQLEVDPAMQNRQTFIPDAQQIKPNMAAVNQYNDFDYEPTVPKRVFNKEESDITRQKGYIPVSQGGYAESTENAPVISYDYATRANAPMADSDVMGKAQDMSLLNAADDSTMSTDNIPNVSTGIDVDAGYKNTPFEATNLALAGKQSPPIEYPSVNPEKSVNPKDSRIELNTQQAYTVSQIMNSGKSDAEKAALLEKYGINPATYLIPGYEKGALVPGLITKK